MHMALQARLVDGMTGPAAASPHRMQVDWVAAYARDSTAVAGTPASYSKLTNILTNAGFESRMADWSDWGNSTAVNGQARSGTYSGRTGPGAGGLAQSIGS